MQKDNSPHKSLVDILSIILDHRVDRTKRHKLIDILVIGLCSALTIGDDFTDIELFGRTKEGRLRDFLEPPGGIVQQKADYLLALKGNQGTAHSEVKEYFADLGPELEPGEQLDFYKTIEKGHGRIENRMDRCAQKSRQHLYS